MKKLIFTLLAAILVMPAFTQTRWAFDKAHTEIGFSVVHMVISEVNGSFERYDGSIFADKEDFSDLRIELTIDASSINTANEKRDRHLRSADFFDVEKFPEIQFKSTGVKITGDHTFKLEGDLTMHGVARKVSLDCKLGGVIKDPYGRTRAGFSIHGMVNRKDFGLTWNNTLESGGVVVSDEVTIEAHVELVREK